MYKFNFAILFFFLSTTAYGQTSPLWANVERGPHRVGFKAVLKYDRARTVKDKTDYQGEPFVGNRFRPINMSVWYPAKSGGRMMKYEDYLFTSRIFQGHSRLSETEKAAIRQTFKNVRVRGGADEKQLDQFLKAEILVSENAPMADGKFPLIVQPSGAYQLDNAALCEYLASHGYVVVHTPAARPTSEYVSDLEFAINYLAENNMADVDRMGAIGFSYGGLVASILQMKSRNLDAVVSLDGVEGWKWGVDEILSSPYYSVRNIDVPFLRFHNAKHDEQTNAPTSKTDSRFYDSMRYSNWTRIEFDKLTHLDFTSGAVQKVRIPNFSPSSPAPHASLLSIQSFIQLQTLTFLNAQVKKSIESADLLERTLGPNGLASKLAVVTRKNREVPPPTASQISALLDQTNGIFIVRRIYDELKGKNDKTQLFTEPQLNTRGYLLLNAKRYHEAVAAFELNVAAFPQSANTHDSLAEAYFESGNKKLALEWYEKTLILDPNNTAAAERIKKLKGELKNP